MSNLISTPPTDEFLDMRTAQSLDKGAPLPFIFQKVRPTISWTTFFSNAYQLLFGLTKSGTASNRPTKGLWLGQPYFDTSLNTMVRLQSVSPAVWTASFQRHKSSAQSITSNTTLTDDSDLTFPVLASEEYIGRCFLDVGASLGTTGIKVSVAGPSGCTGHIVASIVTDTVSAGEVMMLRTDTVGGVLDFTTGDLTINSNNGCLEIVYHITVGNTAGNIRVQFAQSTSSLTAITLRTGSQMKVDKTA